MLVVNEEVFIRESQYMIDCILRGNRGPSPVADMYKGWRRLVPPVPEERGRIDPVQTKKPQPEAGVGQ